MKKTTQKETIKIMLMNELANNPSFAGLSFDDAMAKIERLRKTNESHLSDREYALFIAYKNGLSVYKKYAKTFIGNIQGEIDNVKSKIERYASLIDMFADIKEETLFLMKDRI